MSVHNLYNFRESRFTSLSHELRVFIFGADVTPWLKGDLSITYGNRDSFNNCTFELSNPRKIWQITRDNLAGNWRQAAGEYSESEKLKIFQWKNSAYLNPSYQLDINSVTLGHKASGGKTKLQGPTSLRPVETGTETRYRLAVNDCIFSRNDPMRIFMRNPYALKGGSGEWVEVFCGFLHDHPITTNYQTGESTLRISGYCVRQLLTKMRVQINRLVVQADPQPTFSRSFFADFIDPKVATHPFATTTLENTIKKLILGTETPTTGESAKIVNGLGDFKMGNVVCYDPKAPGNALERWHLMTMFGVNKVPYPTSADDDLWLTTAEMESLGRVTIDIPENYSQGPGGRYLHFLLPAGGTGAGALLQSTVDAQAPRAIEWTTRWEIIREFAGKLDFQVTTSPSGDILVEFPLYGFTPHVFSTVGGTDVNQLRVNSLTAEQQRMANQAGSFGYSEEAQKAVNEQKAYEAKQAAVRAGYTGEIVNEETAANKRAVDRVNSDINSGVTPYGLGALLTFDLHQMEDTLNDEAEDFPTILQVDGGMSLQQANINKGDEAYTNLRAFVYSPVLVSRFGVVAEQMSIPYAGQNTGELSGLPDSVLTKRLGKLALIEYMKRLADSSTWDGSVVFRPFLFPNRPVWLKKSGRIGLLTSVTNRWSIGKSAATSLSMHMLMSERFDPSKPEDERTYFRLPTGSSNTPIDYKSLWGTTDKEDDGKGNPTSGVISVVGTKNPPSQSANGGAGSVGSGQAAPISKTPQESARIVENHPRLYKPFREAIARAIQEAAKLGINVSITSAYRDPKKQEAMKNDPEAWGVARDPKTGGFVQVAEPWKSSHQYGMAVDVSIPSGEYAKFAQICGDSIYWGGAYGDYVHFEWNSQPPGKTGAQAKLYVESKPGLQNSADYLSEVWKHFDAVAGNPTSPAPKPNIRDDGTQTATAEACSPQHLSKRGLDSIPTV